MTDDSRLTVKVPMAKTPHRIAFRRKERVEERKSGIGTRIIMISEEMLKTMLVIK